MNKETTEKNFSRARNLIFFLVSTSLLLACLQAVDAQNWKSMSLGDILGSLRVRDEPLDKKNRMLTVGVQTRGVNFTFTDEIETALRDEGANNELIEAVRQASKKSAADRRQRESDKYIALAQQCGSDAACGILNYSKAIEVNPIAANYAKRGDWHNSQRQFPEAVTDFAKASELAPNVPEYYFWKTFNQLSSPKTDELIKDLSKAIELKPTVKTYLQYRAEIYVRKEMLDEAIQDYTIIIQHPEYSQVFSNDSSTSSYYASRADLYIRKGLTEKGLNDYSEAIRINLNEPELYRRRARQLAYLDRVSDAVKDYTKLLELRPDDLIGFEDRANLYAVSNNTAAALADCTSIIKKQPSKAKGYELRGRIFLYVHDYPDSIKDFDVALTLEPEQKFIHRLRATAFEQLGDKAKAKTDNDAANGVWPFIWPFRPKVISDSLNNRKEVEKPSGGSRPEPNKGDVPSQKSADPSLNPIGSQSGNGGRPLQTGQSSINFIPFFPTPGDNIKEADRIARLGEELRKKEDCPLAILNYTDALKLDPNSDYALAQRGECYRTLGQYEKAIEDLNEAIRRNPKTDFAYASRAVSNWQKGNSDLVLKDLNEAIRLNDKFSWAYQNRGVFQTQNGDCGKAVDDLTKSISLSPKNEYGYLNRSDAFLCQHNREKAISDLNDALKINPNSIETFKRRFSLYLEKNDVEKALADSLKLIELNPKESESYYFLRGVLYFQRESYEEAVRELTKVIDQNGENKQIAYSFRSGAYSFDGNKSMASSDINKALELSKKPIELIYAYAFRGVYYSTLKDFKKAFSDIETALKINIEDKGLASLVSSNVFSIKSGINFDREKYELALTDINSAISLNSTISQYYLLRAEVYKKLRRFAEASIDEQKAKQLIQ